MMPAGPSDWRRVRCEKKPEYYHRARGPGHAPTRLERIVMAQDDYSLEEIIELLEEAESRGISLDYGSDLEPLTIRQLEALVKFVN